MLSATVHAVESAQNCPKLPKFAKICPKTIKLTNLEMPPKIEISVFFKNKNFYVQRKQYSIFLLFGFSVQQFLKCLFYCQKMAFVCEFQHTPLAENDFFFNVPHLLWV
jgi:hypothetical protein